MIHFLFDFIVSKLRMKMLSVLGITILFLKLFVSATDFDLIENSKLVDSKVINLTGTIPPFLHNYQLLNINQEYGDSDEDSGTQSYDYWNTHSNSPSALLKHRTKELYKPINKWESLQALPDGVNSSNSSQDNDTLLNSNNGNSSSVISANNEASTLLKDRFYRPTIENSTSLRKCLEYYRMTVDDSEVEPFIFGGTNAKSREFPHLALLGYGEPNNVFWNCGGSLISEEYVLTAAHCTHSKSHGPVTYVRLGELDINSTADDASVRDFTVGEIITHPLYNFRSNYHDIALLRLNTSIKSFNNYVKPACLATTEDLENIELVIAGWGFTNSSGPRSTILQKTDLILVPYTRCKRAYSTRANLRKGIRADIHICAGGDTERRDTCQGDSGGPLQFLNRRYVNEYMFEFVEIAGITSTGLKCGVIPGLYTRVLPYVEWIESRVWS